MSNYPSLCEELPYWEIEGGSPLSYVILNDGSISSGIEVTPLDIECFDNDRLNQLAMGLRGFSNSIPEGYTMQFHMQIDSDFKKTLAAHESLRTTQNQFLKNLDALRVSKIQSDIEENNLFRPRIFAYLKSPKLEVKSFLSLSVVKKFSKKFAEGFDERLEELSENISGIASSLMGQGFQVRDLSKEELTQNIYRYLNPRRSQNVAPPIAASPTDTQFSEITLNKEPELAVASPRSQLVFGDLILDRDEFVLDQYKTRILSLKTMPENTSSGQMDSFLRFPFHYDLILTFSVSRQAKEISKLKAKQRTAQSLAHGVGTRVRDLESESQLTTTENLIQELYETGQRIYVSELLVILREENSKIGVKLLNQKTREVLSRFKTLSGAEGIQETVGAWKIFKSSLPLAPIQLERGRRMKTNNLVDFLPLYGSRLGDEVPVVLLNNRLGSVVALNPYDPGLSNYNSLVTGSSGSGKSFFNNFLLFQQMARGTRVYIIDIGGSYKKLTELMKGQYFEINLTENYAINPFDLKNPNLAPSSEKVKGLSSIIEQMVSEDSIRLSKLERVLLEKAVTETYDRFRPTGNSPVLSDFEKICKTSKDPELQKIAKLLYSWVGDSAYGKLLDRQGGFNADSPIITFDLKGLSQYPDLQSVMILILTNFILDQVESDRTTSKKVILDEAWQLLQSPAAAGFMEYAARTFRKTGSGITFITQGVEEIARSPIGSAIINNTSQKVVMSQRGDIKLLQDTLKLNSQEISLIQSLQQKKGVFSEAFFIEGEHRQVIRIYPSPLEYWISTSDAKDNGYLSNLMSDGLSLEAAVLRASETAPFGFAALKADPSVIQNIAVVS